MSYKRQPKDEACCGIFFLKYVLLIFNFIFWLSGAGLLAIGLWTLLDRHVYVSLLTSSTYVATTYLLIGTGAVIIVVGTLGCVGALKEHRVVLMAYAFFLLVIFLLEAIAGILAYIYEATVHDELLRGLNYTMTENYMYDLEKTKAIDHMQIEFKCCGAESFRDWRGSKWLKEAHNSSTSTNRKLTPDSCCKSISLGCAVRDHPSNINRDGCLIKFESYLKSHLIILGAVGVGICCLQIFGIVFACCLARRIKEYQERKPTYAW